MQIYSFSPFGYEGALVNVEIDLRRGIPAIDIVGLADGAVKESRERMQVAIRNSGFDFPTERVLISLSPADLRKEGAGFDLPIALGVLAANCHAKNQGNFSEEAVLVMGELELSGHIRPVKGVHAAVATAAANNITKCIIPLQNMEEAMEISGERIYGAENLAEAFEALQKEELFTLSVQNKNEAAEIPEDCINVDGVLFSDTICNPEYAEIKGQAQLVRGLQIAAAGGHNLIAMGAPGCGKTMAIQKFPAINPVLTKEEAQSVTRIWSLAGLIKPSAPIKRIAPFRMPHQTATIEGICGGGPNCRPGEISLAHNGVLFLDEAAEFRSSVLQMLRVPLESGAITLSRAGRSTVYPARFQLLMAVNPCPCGNYGSRTKLCLCSAKSIELYWKKFSGPLLDRIDLRIFVENASDDGLAAEPRPGFETTEEIRRGIAKAILKQRQRQKVKNAQLTAGDVQRICTLDRKCSEILNLAVQQYNFSPRATTSILKVSRTIADIAGQDTIGKEALEEAVSFHKLCSNLTLEL